MLEAFSGSPHLTMNRFVDLKLDLVTPELDSLPFWRVVPMDDVGFLMWRHYVRTRCIMDLKFRDVILQACEADCVFFVLTFGYFHETRDTEDQIGKFAAKLDEQQMNILAMFQRHVGKIDVTIEKTRGIGVSYLIIAYLGWRLFHTRTKGIEFGLLSKDDTSLDIVGRPSTLMGKLDLLIEELPYWYTHTAGGQKIIHRTHTNHRCENKLNNCSVTGYTAKDEKLRSARLFALFVDEAAFLPVDVQRWAAAAHGTAPSIIYVSTHQGHGTMFYRLTRDETSNLVRIAAWWWENSRCAKGLYKSENGQIVRLDLKYRFPNDYEFSHDMPGMLRSPWVDRAFKRPGIDKQSLLEELYGIAASDMRALVRPAIIGRIQSMCVPAARRCMVENGKMVVDPNGEFYFWGSDVPSGTYYIGVDPAIGSKGGAYAGVFALNVLDGAQVCGARLADCPPVELARKVVALGNYLAGTRGAGFARIAFEVTGIGGVFLRELQRLRYPAIVKSPNTQKFGFPNQDRGEAWLVEAARAMSDGDILVYDERIVTDLAHFEYDSEYQLKYTSNDGHGDLAMAAGVCWEGAKRHRRGVIDRQNRVDSVDELNPAPKPSSWSDQFQSEAYNTVRPYPKTRITYVHQL